MDDVGRPLYRRSAPYRQTIAIWLCVLVSIVTGIGVICFWVVAPHHPWTVPASAIWVAATLVLGVCLTLRRRHIEAEGRPDQQE